MSSIAPFVEMDPYTSSLMQAHYEDQQAAIETQRLKEALRPEAFSTAELKEDGYEPVLLIGPESMRMVRIEAKEEHQCEKCGCSEDRPCEGGCLWATETLCSRCALKEAAKGAAGGG